MGRTAVSVLTASLLVVVFALALTSPPTCRSRPYHTTLGDGLSQDFTGLIFLDFLEVNASVYYAHPGTIVHIYVEFSVTWADYGSFWVEARYNGSAIDRETYILIGSGTAIETIDFAWNTAGLDPGAYLISAAASTYSSYEDSYVRIVQTLTVPDDYPTIQAAINAASEGDTIFVKDGTYYENVVVNKTVSLTGETRETTIVDGTGTGHAVSITENNVTIAGFTIVNSMHSPPYSGIYLSNVKNSSILVNAILGGYRGVWLQNASGTVVQDNFISSISDSLAIWLHESNDNVVLANLIRNCSSGICIYYSDNNLVQNNYVTNVTYYGIGLTESSGTSVERNVVSSHVEWYGVSLYASNNGSIIGNSMVDCTPGLRLRGSSGNTIYHNSFINNTIPVVLLDDPLNNAWDNGCEGNYWSDYNGTDLNGDCIGDTYLPWEGVDTYPLMNLYWNPADIDHDLDVDIFDVVTTCNAYGSTPIDPHWNPHCDIAEPYGVIDIFDIVMMCNCYGEEYNP